jgi:hypothetical protein
MTALAEELDLLLREHLFCESESTPIQRRIEMAVTQGLGYVTATTYSPDGRLAPHTSEEDIHLHLGELNTRVILQQAPSRAPYFTTI